MVRDLVTGMEGVENLQRHGQIEVNHRPYQGKDEGPMAFTFYLAYGPRLLLHGPPPPHHHLPGHTHPHPLHLSPLPPQQENGQTVPFLGTRSNPPWAHDLTDRLCRNPYPHGLMTTIHSSLLYHLTSIHLHAMDLY